MKYFRNIFFLGIFILVFGFLVSPAFAATYYIAATGGSDSNSGLSPSEAWVTFNYAWTKLKPGDTLILLDGVYYQSLKPTISGTQTAPITIRAENDGGAIIDGQNARVPCHFLGTSETQRDKTDFSVEGIQCRNSNESVVKISYSQRITLKRISAYNAGPGNSHVFDIYHVNDVFLEDSAASGPGRVMYDIYESSGVKLRRCWGRWMSYTTTSPKLVIQVYGSDDSIIENCIGTMDSSVSDSASGIHLLAHTYNDTADRNKFYGNVVYGMRSWAYTVNSALHRIEGNQYSNSISINNSSGFFQRADADLQATNMTLVNVANNVFSVSPDNSYGQKDPDFVINGVVKNSIFLSGGTGFSVGSDPLIESFIHKYNDLYLINIKYSGTSAGTGEITQDPQFNTVKYGKGAYLIRPSVLKGKGENGGDIGAEVLYRYQNGVLTNIPLWPWPMEDRILKETGVSVTWESQGGLWKTLDGAYPENIASDKIPPLFPTGLRAN